jgi:hypothetical protein
MNTKFLLATDPETGRVLSQSSVPHDHEGGIYGSSIINGECYVNGAQVVPVPPAPSTAHSWDWSTKAWVLPLEAAKEAKWTAVKAARDVQEFGPFTWSGHTFDGDRDAQRRLTVALEAAKEAITSGSEFSTFWKLADNTVISLSAQDVVAVYRACGEHNIRDNHAAAAVKYAQIQAATTIQDLDAI